jgi:hypothetical protein
MGGLPRPGVDPKERRREEKRKEEKRREETRRQEKRSEEKKKKKSEGNARINCAVLRAQCPCARKTERWERTRRRCLRPYSVPRPSRSTAHAANLTEPSPSNPHRTLTRPSRRDPHGATLRERPFCFQLARSWSEHHLPNAQVTCLRFKDALPQAESGIGRRGLAYHQTDNRLRGLHQRMRCM